MFVRVLGVINDRGVTVGVEIKINSDEYFQLVNDKDFPGLRVGHIVPRINEKFHYDVKSEFYI